MLHSNTFAVRRASKLALKAGVALSVLASAAAAQDADTEDKEESFLALEEVVVTGTPGGSALRKLDASFAITSLNGSEIKKFSPKSTADLFKAVPGVFAESSSGESGANVFVRGFPGGGDAEFVTVQLDGLPIFTPPTLSFLENSTLFRIDETVERVEALRGGPNPVFSNGQPGVTFNFIQKKGGPETEGLIKLSTTDFGERRVDAVLSGPLGDDLYYSVGGFYRVSDGIRDTQFTSEEGGQFSANITKLFDNGEINVYTRYLKDRNQWLLPIPLLSDADGNVDDFPGFDAGTGTFLGNDLRLGTIINGNGELEQLDAADGRGPDIFTIGASAEFELGNGFSIREKFNVVTGEANTIGLVPGGNVRTAGEYLEEFGAGTTGSFSFVSTGGALTDLNTLVTEIGFWDVKKDISSFSNDFALSYEATSDVTITGGVFYSHFTSDDRWTLGNNQLTTVESNATRLDVVLDDGRIVTRDGFSGSGFFAVNAAYSGDTVAGYLAGEWQVTPDLRIDAGLRVENYQVDATLENLDTVDLDGDANTLYDNNTALLNGTFRSIDFNETEFSWTVGANYNFTDSFSAFARINQGSRFPQFDNLRDGQDLIQEVDQYELGLKASGANYGIFATVFYNEFTGLPFQQFAGGQNVTRIGDSEAFGVELEAKYEPVENLTLQITGTWQDAEFNNFGGQSGNAVPRQPDLLFRFTPSYEFELPFGSATLYGTYTYVDDRFSDPENFQFLPSYDKFDLGLIVDTASGWQFQVVADNLTDEIGLTEGNPRVLGGQTGTVFARPILGRSFRFSVGYSF